MQSKKIIKQILVFSLIYVFAVVIFNFSVERLFFTVLSLIVVAPIMYLVLWMGSRINHAVKNSQEKIENPTMQKINKFGGIVLLLLIIATIIVVTYILENSLG